MLDETEDLGATCGHAVPPRLIHASGVCVACALPRLACEGEGGAPSPSSVADAQSLPLVPPPETSRASASTPLTLGGIPLRACPAAPHNVLGSFRNPHGFCPFCGGSAEGHP